MRCLCLRLLVVVARLICCRVQCCHLGAETVFFALLRGKRVLLLGYLGVEGRVLLCETLNLPLLRSDVL